MTIKPEEEPRMTPAGAQFRRALDAGTTASVAIRVARHPRASRPRPPGPLRLAVA